MRVLGTVVASLALMALCSGGVHAQGVTVRLTIDCEGDPETLTVTNTGPRRFVVDSIVSGVGMGDEVGSYTPSDRVAAGERIMYEAGHNASGPHVLDRKTFLQEMEGDGVIVRIIPEGVSERIFDTHWKESSVFVRCRQRSLEYSVTSQTFKLTLLGKVPEKQRFRVEYGRFPLGRDGVTGTDLCRDPRLEWPGDIPPACRGGTTHRKTVPQVTSPPSRETWRVRWIRATTDCTLPRADPSMCEFRDQVFHTSRLSPAKGGTHSAWYDFDTHKGGTGAGPEGLMPGGMPSTGGGGMARLTR